MGFVIQDRHEGYLLSGTTASGAGGGTTFGSAGMDTRNAANFAYLEYASWSPSAILKLEASHDRTGWLPVMTVTATPSSGTAQISAYFPYVRGVFVTGYSTTGSAVMYYSPGTY